MKTRACPLCRQVMLIRSGATVTCGACSFPITGQRLSIPRENQTGGAKRVADFRGR